MASLPTEYFELIHSDNPIVREKTMKNNIKAEKIDTFRTQMNRYHYLSQVTHNLK